MLQPFLKTGVALARQEQILKAIQADPLGSYVFSGPAGVGKTMLFRELQVLARAACPKNFAIYAKTATQYQGEMTRSARGERVPGLFRTSALSDSAHGIKWAVFLDDIDKVSGSEFIHRELLDLFDAVCTQRTPSTQLVLTTNMSKAEFKKFFGDAIERRVTAQCLWVSMEREG